MDPDRASKHRAVQLTLDDIPFGGITERLLNGDVIPFLGAGASLAGVVNASSKLPNGRQLADELRQALDPYPGDETDPLTKVTQFYVECVFGRLDLYKTLHARFFKSQENAALSSVALLLADVPHPLRIVTTNFDCHVEAALDRVERPYSVISHVVDRTHPSFGKVFVKSSGGEVDQVLARELVLSDFAGQVLVYKMHGTAEALPGEEPDTLVITEDDYIDFLTTGASIPPPAITAHLQNRHFLFLGYSLEDWNFRVILRRLEEKAGLGEAGSDGIRHWAIQLDPSTIEGRFWDRRAVTVYNAPLDAFAARLRTHLTRAEGK